MTHISTSSIAIPVILKAKKTIWNAQFSNQFLAMKQVAMLLAITVFNQYVINHSAKRNYWLKNNTNNSDIRFITT
jgi:hypothetical protein